MKKTIIVLLTLLILLISISTVSAEENTTNDTNNLTDLDLIENNLTEDSTHNHTEASSIIDGPVKATVRYASGGTFANFQTVINGASNGDIIEVTGDYYQASTSRININKRVTINGNGHTFDAQYKSTIFYVTQTSTFNNLNLINGKVTGNGNCQQGSILITGTSVSATFNGCSFVNNSRTGSATTYPRGCALSAYSYGNIYITDCVFKGNYINLTYSSSNTAGTAGAGIAVINGNSIYIVNTTFEDNIGIGTGPMGISSSCIFIESTYTQYTDGLYFNNNFAYQETYGYTSPDVLFHPYSRNADVTFINSVSTDANTLSIAYRPGVITVNINVYNNWFGSNNPIDVINNAFIDNWLVMGFTNTTPLTTGSVGLKTTFYLYNRTSNTYTLAPDNLIVPRPVNYTAVSGSVSPTTATLTGTNVITGSFSASSSNAKVTAKVDNQISTLSVSGGNFAELQSLIDATAPGGTLTLTKNYTFNTATDLPYMYGMFINKPITINGNGYTIDAMESPNTRARIFNITGNNVKLNDLNIINGFSYLYIPNPATELYDGGAIYNTGNNLEINNCNFTNNGGPSGYFVDLGWGSMYNGGAIYSIGGDIKITNCNFFNNSVSNRGGGFCSDGGDIEISNSCFANNSADGYGGALYFTNGELIISNSSFIENSATVNSAGAISSEYSTIYVSDSKFINNTAITGGAAIDLGTVDLYVTTSVFEDNVASGSSSKGGAIWSNSFSNVIKSVFVNNWASQGQAIYGKSGDILEYNWWGENDPAFSSLIKTSGNPETWVVMNFTNLKPINSTNYGINIPLVTLLNNLYNDTDGTYTTITGLPKRMLVYNSTAGYYTHNETSIIGKDDVNYTYPSGLTGLILNATIDNQVLTIETADIEVTLSVDYDTPVILQTITYTVRVDNNGPGNARGVKTYFKPPTGFIYQSDDSGGAYNTTTGEWYIGDIDAGDYYELNIEVKLPYNKSLENKTINSTAKVTGIYADLYNDNDNSTVNITIAEKTGGSYLDFQYLIDTTPDGGTIVMGFNVTYDPRYDASLVNGMILNKSITIKGNGYTISGNNTARIFRITTGNVILKDINITKGYWGSARTYNGGGAIIVTGGITNITIINCSFVDNFVRGWGGAIYAQSFDNFVVKDSYFNNNVVTYGSWTAGGAIMIYPESDYALAGNNLIINNTVFDNNYATTPITNGQEAGAVYVWSMNNINITHSIFTNNGVWASTSNSRAGAIELHANDEINVNYNVFVDNYSPYHGSAAYVSSNANLEYNWWGTNTPNFNNLIEGVTPETYVIMNFTNTTPVNYSPSGSSNLLVTLNTVYNDTDGNYYPLSGSLPARTLYFDWNYGNVTPNTTNIFGSVTGTFDYLVYPDMPAWVVNATIDDQTLWIGSSDIAIDISPNYDPIDDGENISYIVTVMNNGPLNSTDINATLYLPLFGLLNITVIANDGVYNNTTGVWEIGFLDVGDYVTLEINGTLADPGPNLIWNATVNFGSRYDYNHTNNTFVSNVTVNQISDLEIHKNLTGNVTPQTKDNITYMIMVFNNGPSTAINVTVFDNLSSKLIYINSSATIGYYNETTGIWFLDNLTPYSNETLNITVLVNKSGFVNNFVNVTSNITDNNLTNNYDNYSFMTPPLSDLWVTITMEPQTSNYITYHIQAGNNGIEDANGTVVVFNLSNLYVYFNHTEDKGVYNNLTGVWDIGELNVNETVNMTLIVRLDFPSGTTFANVTTSVNITSWSTDLYPSNNTDNVTFEAEIFGNFRLLQDIVDGWPENTTQILPRSFAYDPVLDAKWPGETYDLIDGVRLYKNVTIVNPNGFTLGGFDMARIFNISADNVILDGLKFYDGTSPLGGAINIHSDNVQVLRSNFTGNWLFGDYGGAIFTNGRNTLICDNIFKENSATKLGGAIGAVGARNLKILNNTFINNTVESDSVFGGAVGIANSTAVVNGNVFLDNWATNAPNLGSAIYTDNSNVNLEANWFGNNTPNMTDNKLIWGVKPETYVVLDWEIVNPTMTGVTLNAVFLLYNRTSGNKTPIGYGLPYRTVNITARNPTLSWYNKTFTGNNTVNYTYNVAIPVYQVNATVDYQTITLEWSTFLDAYKSLVNDTVWFGDDLIYIINLTNYGPHNSYIITVSDLLPENLTINSVTPVFGSTSIIGDDVYWTLVLNAGDNATLIVNTTPTREAFYTNNLTVNSTNPYDYFLHGNSSVTGEVLPLIDLSINITISNPPYYVGEDINYTITIHNNGPSNATNVWAYIPIPSGLKFLYVWNLDGYIPNYNNVTGWWNVSTLNAGETIQINMTLRLNKSGEYNQTVNITGYGVELNDTDNNMTVYFNVTTQVDLELNMTMSTTETLYGNIVSITYSLINKGPSPAINTTVFTVFSGLTFSSSTGYGSFSNITPFTGYWYVGNLSKNKLVTRTVYFYANSLGNFTVTGKANCSDNESYWSDNYANVTLKVIKYADISITKTVSNKTPFLEQTILYTITVRNNAGFDAENVTVYDPLPSVLVYDNSTTDYNGTHWLVGNLTVGQTKTLTFNVTVDGIGIIWNNATVNSSLNDSNWNNNHAEVNISVPVADDLRMFISVIPNPPSSSSSFIINLSVWNRGFTDNQNVTVEFHIPSSLTYLNSTNMGAYNQITGFWNIGFLANGSWANLLIWVNPNTIGNVTLEANVSGQVADVAPGNNRANITFEIIPAFD